VLKARQARGMAQRVRDKVPKDLQARLETLRLDLLALFRALDRLVLAPPEVDEHALHALFELDADLAEALVVLDFPLRGIDVASLLAETLASLGRIPMAREDLLRGLAPDVQASLAKMQTRVRATLDPDDAYHSINGRGRGGGSRSG
jgi:hypothetical protein